MADEKKRQNDMNDDKTSHINQMGEKGGVADGGFTKKDTQTENKPSGSLGDEDLDD